MKRQPHALLLFWWLLWLACSTPPPAQAQGPVHYADWQLEWAEEFNAPTDTVALAARWRFAYPWGRNLAGNPESEYYSGRGVQPTANGVMHLVAQRLDTPVVYRGKSLRYSSGMLLSRKSHDQFLPATCWQQGEGFSYGLFEMRCRLARTHTAWPAFWLYGGVPDEVDIFESDVSSFSSTIHINNEPGWRPTQARPETCACTYFNADPASNLCDQFHTYGLCWQPNELVFYFDGVPIRHETRHVPTGCPMYLIANLAIVDWATAATDTLTVDYIRVYRPKALPQPTAMPAGAYLPQPELKWLPATTHPGRADQSSFQGWQLRRRSATRLSFELTDNYNPSCNLALPLPIAGHWAPAWLLTHGTPEVRVALPGTDTVHWELRDLTGRLWLRGHHAPGRLWRPQWPTLPPGGYCLQVRQGQARGIQAVTILGRPAGSAPTTQWLEPVAPILPAHVGTAPETPSH